MIWLLNDHTVTQPKWMEEKTLYKPAWSSWRKAWGGDILWSLSIFSLMSFSSCSELVSTLTGRTSLLVLSLYISSSSSQNLLRLMTDLIFLWSLVLACLLAVKVILCLSRHMAVLCSHCGPSGRLRQTVVVYCDTIIVMDITSPLCACPTVLAGKHRAQPGQYRVPHPS